VLAALAETSHDENGLSWPLSVAPYEVLLIPLNVDDAELMKVANSYYDELKDNGVDVLMDDRDQRPGFKFKDADLIGIPLRVVIGGKGLQEGKIEYKWRTDSAPQKTAVDTGVETILGLLDERRKVEASRVPG
ncbi:MAG: His/Gly/Thr/Pro-type tRNA ligase C-terminal domain-containing protein, partial [Planctomycetota bacterium]|nr:His/Gly/Thr/Pro-type tRNA ligase C-terminal domain-containing protein [Planctomycetota bacterium]